MKEEKCIHDPLVPNNTIVVSVAKHKTTWSVRVKIDCSNCRKGESSLSPNYINFETGTHN